MTTKPLIEYSLHLLDMCGLNPFNQTRSSRIRMCFTITLSLILCVEFFLEIILNWKGLSSMEVISVFAPILQLTFKTIVMITHRDLFIGLIKHFEKFPPLESYERRLQQKINDYFRSTRKFGIISAIAVLVGCLVYMIIPLLYSSRKLPFRTYHPVNEKESPQYEITYIILVFSFMYECVVLVSNEIFFFAFLIHIMCELKLVKHRLSNIVVNVKIKGDEEECLRMVYQLVDHHNLVLDCIKLLQDIYSIIFLNQFLMSLISICSGLLSIIASGFPPDGVTIVIYIIYLLCGLLQLFCYCMGGSYLILETESISMIAFQTDWWIKPQPKFRKSLMLIIQRANKTGKLIAGGMYTVNLESFAGVVSQAWSFFRLIQALYTRQTG